MKTFIEYIDWFHRRAPKDAARGRFCQCGTEKIIRRSSSQSEKMRAFLLVSVFMDQFVSRYYHDFYEVFCEKYCVPKLQSHGGFGVICPSWFIYSKRGYDENVDWEQMGFIAGVIVGEVRTYLEEKQSGFNNRVFDENLCKKISDFEEKHQEWLMRAFHVKDCF